MKNQEVTRYYETLRELLPKITMREGRFLRDFKHCLMEYERQNPKCTYEDLVEEFSTPEDNVQNFVSEQGTEYFFALMKRKKYGKYGKYVARVLIAAIVFVAVVISVFVYKAYQDSKESIPAIKEIEIFYEE